MKRYLPNIVAGWSALCFGLFVVEVLRKNGLGGIAIMVLALVVAAGSAYVKWMFYAKFVAGFARTDEASLHRKDAYAYLPLTVMTMMFARDYWPAPRLGLFLFIVAALMCGWIKVYTAVSLRRGKTPSFAATYAPPIGFALALVCQMAWGDLNIPRFIVMGQLKTAGIWIVIVLTQRLKHRDSGNRRVAGESKQ